MLERSFPLLPSTTRTVWRSSSDLFGQTQRTTVRRCHSHIFPETHSTHFISALITLAFLRVDAWGRGAGGVRHLRFQTVKPAVVLGERKCRGSCCCLVKHHGAPLWMRPGSTQVVVVVGAAELGARGQGAPVGPRFHMCRKVAFGPLMTLFPRCSGLALPPNLEAICLVSTEKVQAWSPPASAECLFTHNT